MDRRNRFLLSLLIITSAFFWSFEKQILASEITSTWSNTSQLNNTHVNTQLISQNGMLYLLGGTANHGITRSHVFSNSINVNGSLNAWISQASMNKSLIWHSAELVNNRIYVVGGVEEPSGSINSTNSISFSDIDSSGNILSWNNVTPDKFLPERLGLGSLVKVGKYLYFIGGATWTNNWPPVLSSDIYFTEIFPDNNIGQWANSNINLPTDLAGHGSVVFGDKIYILGGSTSNTFAGTNKVYVFQSDPLTGQLTQLSDEDNLPVASRTAMITRIGDYIIHAGGVVNGASTDEVYFAHVSDTGDIGPWELSTNLLPQLNCCTSITSWNNFLYIAGGHLNGGAYYNSVIYTETNIPPTTPTPTPTITPTPIPPDSIVFIPGFAGSWNSDAILNCKDDDYSGEWSLAPFAEEVYEPIMNSLSQNGLNVVPFYYDWRKPIISNIEKIDDIVNNNSGTNQDIHFLGHSMGGLLARAYLESEGEQNKIDKLMTVGSPHRGVVFAYPAWASGKVWNENLIQKIGMTIALKRCGGLLDNDRLTLQTHFPSTRNFIPVFDFIKPRFSPVFTPISDMVIQNDWINPNSGFDFHGVDVGTLSGLNESTLISLETKDPSKRDLSLGNWLDGDPTKKVKTQLGDGSVPNISSSLPGAQNIFISGNHEEIINSKTGIINILNFFNLPTTNISSSRLSPSSAIVLLSNSGKFKKGQFTPDDLLDIYVKYDPESGEHEFYFIPDREDAEYSIAVFKKDGEVDWKDFKVHEKKHQTLRVNFNP